MKNSTLLALLLVCSAQLIKIGALVFLSEAAYAAELSDTDPHETEENEGDYEYQTPKKRKIVYLPLE